MFLYRYHLLISRFIAYVCSAEIVSHKNGKVQKGQKPGVPIIIYGSRLDFHGFYFDLSCAFQNNLLAEKNDREVIKRKFLDRCLFERSRIGKSAKLSDMTYSIQEKRYRFHPSAGKGKKIRREVDYYGLFYEYLPCRAKRI